MRDSDAYQITWLIRRLFRGMSEMATSYLEPLGITAADRAILEFLFTEGNITVPEIAKRYKVSRQHVQVTVNRLQDDGFVLIKTNPSHKRSSLISLSAKGKALFRKIQTRDEKAIKQIFSNIPIDKQRITREVLQTLLQSVTKGEKA